MSRKARKLVRIIKFLLAGVTVFCVSWIASVSEWHAGLRFSAKRQARKDFTTMRTIVGYAEDQGFSEKPYPVACDRLPIFPDVPTHNTAWSPGSHSSVWQKVEGTKLSLFAAYYDERNIQKYVRILAMFRGRNITNENTLYCQTRSLGAYDDFIEVVAAKPLEIWWPTWDRSSTEVETPILLSCPLTEDLVRPSVVSIVTRPCDDPKNAFHLYTKNETKRNFTICVKDMNFNKDISQNLIEWIEINRILGVGMIDFYVEKISKLTEKVLQYYEKKSFVRLFNVPIRSNGNRSLWQRRRDHVVSYNDCLYRNINESEFIIPLDVDEIIIPKKTETLSDLVVRLRKHGWGGPQHAAIMIRNVFFFDFMQNIEQYKKNKLKNIYLKRDDVRINKSVDVIPMEERDVELYKMRCGSEMPDPKISMHVISSAVVSPFGDYGKSIMLTKKILTAFNHYPLGVVDDPGLGVWQPPLEEVQLNHYRESCNSSSLLEECPIYSKQVRVDNTARRFQNQLIHNLANTICGQ